MIAGLIGELAATGEKRHAVSQALARYAAVEPQNSRNGPSFLAASPRDCLGTHGHIALAFTGWIDNADALRHEHGLPPGNDATLYAALLDRLGEGCDNAIHGCYAAIACLGEGELRLARAPWDAPPLYYHRDEEGVVASPLMRALFAAGVEERFDEDRMVDLLACDWRPHEEQAWHHGVRLVPLGASVRVSVSGSRTNCWYRLPRPMAPGDYREEEAVSEATRLLDEAAGKALDWAARPALSLSGGLDSPLVAASLVRKLAVGDTLTTITFAPDEAWRGAAPPGTMGDETSLVRELAEALPQIEAHFASREVGGMDRGARELFTASRVFAPGTANVAMVHNVYRKARELGCDSLLVADMGNATFSYNGWAGYCEYLRSGEWRQLHQLLRARTGDDRPLWRRFVALSVMPHVPARVRRAIRGRLHRRGEDMAGQMAGLSKGAWDRHHRLAKARGSGSTLADPVYDTDRKSEIAHHWDDADGPGHDVHLAFEQLYGIRRRDVTAYRPLVEFCMSLPSRAFARDGTERRLARLMGRARLPDTIRLNRLHGQHNVDWHERIARDREAIRQAFAAAKGHAVLSRTLDLEQLLALVDDWPVNPEYGTGHEWTLRHGLPRALAAVRYVGAVEGRNEF